MKDIPEASTVNKGDLKSEEAEDIMKANSTLDGKEKKKNRKDQNKITSYFTPTRKSDDDKKSPVTSRKENYIDDSNVLSNPNLEQSTSTKENLSNGSCTPKYVQMSICTRSQSLKLSENKEQPKHLLDENKLITSPSLEKKGAVSPSLTMLPISPDIAISPTSSLHSGPPTPHKIQALNEEKLRMDSHLSPSTALSKLKIISPAKFKFPQKYSKVKRKLPHDSISVDKLPSENTSNDEPNIKEPTPVILNGSLKSNLKPKMRNTQMTEFFPIRRSHRKPKTTLMQEKQKQINERIINRCEEGLAVHNFDKKGRGIVTTRLFKKGEMVVEYVGDLIDTKDAKEREKKYALDSSKGCYMYYFTFQNNQYCIDATEESSFFGRLVNHSRNGNLATKTVEVKDKPHLILIAKKDIEPGTEILYDYGDRSKQALENHPWLAL